MNDEQALKSTLDLTGTGSYEEEYTNGKAKGELYLRQEGEKLSGRVVFTDQIQGEEPYMIQEFMEGSISGRKIKLEAKAYDVIHSESEICYDLDRWIGVVLRDHYITGMSTDKQQADGYFTLKKLNPTLPERF